VGAGEIASRDGTALAAGLRVFFCGRELIDALPLSMQAGKLAPGSVVTAQMVVPAYTSTRNTAASASASATAVARPSRFVGLRNQGATCYLNSLVQCLYMTPELRRGLQLARADQPPGSVSSALSSLFSALASASSAVSTEALTRALASALVGGSSSRQEDVHEFWQVGAKSC
jgi:ubiquitin C-terminal hydrolase